MGRNEYIARGDLLRQQGRIKEALAEYERALSIEPDSARAHACRAFCLSEQKKHKEGLKAAEEALIYAPDYAYAHRIRSLILVRMTKVKDAKAAIERALELDPYDPYNFYMLAVVAEASSNRPMAVSYLEKGLELAPDNNDLLIRRARLLKSLGRKQESLQASLAAIRNNPDDQNAHAVQGYALLSQGKHQEALESFKTALRIDPNSAWAQQGLREALRARFPLYKALMAWRDFTDRLGGARYSGIVGFVIIRAILETGSRTASASAPVAIAIAVVVLAMMALWLSGPITNIALLFHPIGKYALPPIVRVIAMWLAILFGWCVVCGLLVAFWRGGAAVGFAGPAIFGFILMFCASKPEQFQSKNPVAAIHALGGIGLVMGILGGLTGGS